MLVDEAEDRVGARRHPERAEQPRARLCSRRKAGADLRFGQAVRAAGMTGDKVRERLGERPPRAQLAEATNASNSQAQTDRAVADGQVCRRTGVEAVDAP